MTFFYLDIILLPAVMAHFPPWYYITAVIEHRVVTFHFIQLPWSNVSIYDLSGNVQCILRLSFQFFIFIF